MLFLRREDRFATEEMRWEGRLFHGNFNPKTEPKPFFGDAGSSASRGLGAICGACACKDGNPHSVNCRRLFGRAVSQYRLNIRPLKHRAVCINDKGIGALACDCARLRDLSLAGTGSLRKINRKISKKTCKKNEDVVIYISLLRS